MCIYVTSILWYYDFERSFFSSDLIAHYYSLLFWNYSPICPYMYSECNNLIHTRTHTSSLWLQIKCTVYANIKSHYTATLVLLSHYCQLPSVRLAQACLNNICCNSININVQYHAVILYNYRCKIDWKKGKNVTVKTIKKKQKHKGAVCVYLSVCLSICLSLSVCLSVPVCLSVCLFVYLSVYLTVPRLFVCCVCVCVWMCHW